MYTNNLISLKQLNIIPELFLSITILLLLLYGIFLSTKKQFLLIHKSILNLGILVLFLILILLFNDPTSVIEINNFNNTIVSDSLSYFTKVFITAFSIFSLIVISQYLTAQKINSFEYILLYLFAILGLFLLSSSNDLITAYLSIELQSLSLYVMSAFKKNSNYSIDAGLKYFILGSFASGLFLFGASLIYGFTGSTNFDDFKDLFFWVVPGNITLLNHLDRFLWVNKTEEIHSAFLLGITSNESYKLSELETLYILNNNNGVVLTEDMSMQELNPRYSPQSFQDFYLFTKVIEPTLLQLALVFIFVSLFFKLALAPFHIWLPDVYEGSLTSSTFFFAIIPKLGLFTLLIRITYYCFTGFFDYFQYFMGLVALLSIIVGSFTAIEQRKLKTLFAYSSIGHMGYSLLAYTSGTIDGIQMLLLYLIIYMLAGAFIWAIFLLTKLNYKFKNKTNKDLAEFSSLFKANSVLALILSLVLLSLAGFPPLIGFLAKTSVFLVSIESSIYLISILAILCSVISTFYYIRIIKIIFFENKLTGNLYYSYSDQKAFIIILCFYFFIFLFINLTFLYLLTYKVSLLITLS